MIFKLQGTLYRCQTAESTGFIVHHSWFMISIIIIIIIVTKYDKLAATHVFYPFAIETAGTWDVMAIKLTQEIGRCITSVTEETRETTFLFQRLSNPCLFKEWMRSPSKTHWHPKEMSLQPFEHCLVSYSRLQALFWWAKKIKNNKKNKIIITLRTTF